MFRACGIMFANNALPRLGVRPHPLFLDLGRRPYTPLPLSTPSFIPIRIKTLAHKVAGVSPSNKKNTWAVNAVGMKTIRSDILVVL